MCKEAPFPQAAPLPHFAKCATTAPHDPRMVQVAIPTQAASHGFVDFVCDQLESLTRSFQEVDDTTPDVTQQPETQFDYSFLHAAVKAPDFRLVEQLCKTYGNTVNENGFTAMHAAAAFGHVEVVEMLLLFGCDMNRVTQAGTPLHCAVTSGKHAVVATLLFANADPNTCLWNGITPLHLAAKKGDTWSVQKLLEAGATPTALDANGMTPLNMATIHNAPHVLCNLLVEKEAELKLVNVDVDSFLENMEIDLDSDLNPFQGAVQMPLNVLTRPMEVPAFG